MFRINVPIILYCIIIILYPQRRTVMSIFVKMTTHITLFNNNLYDNIGKVGIILKHRWKLISVLT